MDEEVVRLIRKLSYLNAVKHEGKGLPGPVVSGLLGEFPDLKQKMKEIMPIIAKTLQEANSKDLESQKEELIKIDPSALDKKEHKVDLFGFLGIQEGEKIITAFPPGPEKYPHIGHAKALLLNYELAKHYNGKFYLRFEDTNPELVRQEFYGIMENDFKWLGVKWDKLIYASDHMELYYGHCKDLLSKGHAYVCTCSQDDVKSSREKGKPCKCRGRSEADNVELWMRMPEMGEGGAIVRMKIDLEHKNTTMRDPTIFRIIKAPHARLGSRYAVWPNYDFQNCVMDGHFKITHRLRSKEFEMRNELQRYIQRLLGYKETKIYEFARFNLEGVESSGRIIREKVANGELVGWDDPSLTTLAALRRRGFQPEAIKEFVLKTGITKNEATLKWDDLILHNKRVLDDVSDRYFFVADPVEVYVEGAPKRSFELDLHHEHRKGGRKFNAHTKFYIAKNDFKSIHDNGLYRLMECLNFRKQHGRFVYVDDSIDTYKKDGVAMMHYVPVSESVKCSVLMPDKTVMEGVAESSISNVREGAVIQFERFGFVRLDDKKDMRFWFTH